MRKVPEIPTVEIRCRRCGKTITVVWNPKMGKTARPIELCTSCARSTQD
jgi:predicted nucleic acid-binding Zn ribbon protein